MNSIIYSDVQENFYWIFVFHTYFFMFNNLYSLAQPMRYVGRKPHRYTFAVANTVHMTEVGSEQVKIYLNSGQTKGNGNAHGAIYNKVIAYGFPPHSVALSVLCFLCCKVFLLNKQLDYSDALTTITLISKQ